MWEKGAHRKRSTVLTQNGSSRYWSYLEVYWSCAGRLLSWRWTSTVRMDAIAERKVGGRRKERKGKKRNTVSKYEIQPGYGEWWWAGWRGTGQAEPVSRDQILRRERGQGNWNFPVQLTTSRIGHHTGWWPVCYRWWPYLHVHSKRSSVQPAALEVRARTSRRAMPFSSRSVGERLTQWSMTCRSAIEIIWRWPCGIRIRKNDSRELMLVFVFTKMKWIKIPGIYLYIFTLFIYADIIKSRRTPQTRLIVIYKGEVCNLARSIFSTAGT